MARDIASAVREICLSFPQVEQFLSHGSPNFRVRGKTFASYIVNHHGDGRIALWLNSPAGAQDFHTRDEPRYFFVPPYVGPRGWLGVQLDKGLAWSRVAALVRDAYVKVAPKSLTAQLGRTIEITPPTRVPDASERNPLLATDARYSIPMYLGHVGWIELDVRKGCVERELRALALDSYRHFALKRMLAAL